jgi:hypothetical protein
MSWVIVKVLNDLDTGEPTLELQEYIKFKRLFCFLAKTNTTVYELRDCKHPKQATRETFFEEQPGAVQEFKELCLLINRIGCSIKLA